MSTRAAHNQRVATIYKGVIPYLQVAWMHSTDLAVHLGYWDDRTRTHNEALINMNRQLAARAAITSSDQILDAGCGIGGSSIWLARTYGCRVFGITIIREHAHLARKLATQRQVADLSSFTAQDYTALALPDASFDVVWAIESVCHAQVKKTFFKEAWRVLKPGGRLIMTDWLRRGRNYKVDDESHLKQWLWSYGLPDLDTPDEYINAMRELGFCNIQYEDISARVWRSNRRVYLQSFYLIPLTYLFRWSGLRPSWLVDIAYAANAQYLDWKRGLWMQAIFSARK